MRWFTLQPIQNSIGNFTESGWLPDRVSGGGRDHAGGVEDIRHTCGWCIRVSWTVLINFRVLNKFIRILQQYRTNHRTDGPEGDISRFGMLEGGGRYTGIVSVIVDPFWATFIYKVFWSGHPLSVPEITDRRPERGVSMFDVIGGVWSTNW